MELVWEAIREDGLGKSSPVVKGIEFRSDQGSLVRKRPPAYYRSFICTILKTA